MKKHFDALKSRLGDLAAIAVIAAALCGVIGPIIAGGIALAQTYYRLPANTIHEAHVLSSGLPGTINNSGTLANAANDFVGAFTQTSNANATTYTFQSAFTVTPFCLAADETSAEGIKATPSTTTLVFSGQLSGDKVAWLCVGSELN